MFTLHFASKRQLLVMMLTSIFVSFFYVTMASAGSAIAGTVNEITIQTSGGTNGAGVALFVLSSSHVSAPACHVSANRWAIDLGKESGRAMEALIMASYLSGKRIVVQGTNNCNVWADTESAQYITAQP